MVLINDDELGAYRTSEIAMRLVAMMEDKACLCDDDVPTVEIEMSKDKDGNLVIEVEKTEKTEKGDRSEKADKDDSTMEKVMAELDLGRTREKLGALANQAGKSGNVKAAYLIERAIDDLI